MTGSIVRKICEAKHVWRLMNTIPGYTEQLKEDFSSFTGKGFALFPEEIINTANLLAAVDHKWTVNQVNRILDEARSLYVPEAYQVIRQKERTPRITA